MQASQFKMIDVGNKVPTYRRAVAQGHIRLSREAFLAIQNDQNPKGNVLGLAEVSGILAAKKTPELLPLCHPLPLEKIRVYFQLLPEQLSVVAFCEVSTIAKTGVEMEAISGVQGALLCIYDLSKAVDPVITLSEIRLNTKEGGKNGMWTHPEYQPKENQEPSNQILNEIRACVITVSDRVSVGQAEDLSGPTLASLLKNAGCVLSPLKVVSDDKQDIQKVILHAAREEKVQLIMTTGGTGLGPRDVTPEAIQEISDRLIPGFGECFRNLGSRNVDSAWLSRSLGAQIGRSLVLALPGSHKAVREGWEAIYSFLPHAIHIIAGGNHD